MWFKNEANLVTMIEMLKVVKEELEKANLQDSWQGVKARLEVSSQRKPLTKAQALFFKGLKEMKGDESKVQSDYGKHQICFFVCKDVAGAKATTEEGWVINFPVGFCNLYRVQRCSL